MKTTVILLLGALSAFGASAAPPWLETDSARAICGRIERDFSLTLDEALPMILERYPGYTKERVRRAVENKWLETREIDGQTRVFRKGVRNLGLLDPELNGGWTSRNFDVSDARLAQVDSILADPDGRAMQVTYRFCIDVPYDPAIAGDTLRVWMPVPIESERQTRVHIISASPADYILSEGRSLHNTIHFKAPAPAVPGDTAHFEYTGIYDVRPQYFDPTEIRAKMLPYDKSSDLYRTYTQLDGRHYVPMDSLAAAVAGDARDPFEASERVFDYIESTYPWAGALEYSTIPSIPRYVVKEGHGDCGEVALLYISMMRSLGIPARWESGWMTHPGAQNYHDWAEVYFEGVGWVPVDVSFGRYARSSDPRVRNFYSTGMDQYRFATNRGICDALYPPKRFVRSETVDHQAGEVECSRGNLFWPAWDSSMDIISMKNLKK